MAPQRGGRVVVIVSGAKCAYLRPWCEARGFELLASSVEIVGGRLTGRYIGTQCVGEEKARGIRSAFDLSRYRQVHAYGDTDEDAAMLALADHAHFRCMPAPGDRSCGWSGRRLAGMVDPTPAGRFRP